MFFLDLISKTKVTKAKINKWNYIKLKGCFIAKETINKIKRQPTEWEKIFANHISNNGLVSRIYKELSKLNVKKDNNSIRKWARDTDMFTKEDIEQVSTQKDVQLP